jgi:hypothetical protein
MTNKLVGFLVCGVTLLGAASFCMAQGIGDAGVQPAGGRGGFGARKPLPPVVVPDKDYTAWPLTPEQAQYKDIDGFHLKKDYLMPIVAISEKSKADGNVYWGRIAGTPYDQMNGLFARRAIHPPGRARSPYRLCRLGKRGRHSGQGLEGQGSVDLFHAAAGPARKFGVFDRCHRTRAEGWRSAHHP